jgi:hypothetical protein
VDADEASAQAGLHQVRRVEPLHHPGRQAALLGGCGESLPAHLWVYQVLEILGLDDLQLPLVLRGHPDHLPRVQIEVGADLFSPTAKSVRQLRKIDPEPMRPGWLSY